MMPMEDWSEPNEVVGSDACLLGRGEWFKGKNVHFEFPEFIRSQSLHISALELLTVIMCAKLWGSEWKGQRIMIACDNKILIDVVNEGRARDKFLLMCMRELVWLAATFEFEIRTRNISGMTNRLPDLLSRWSFSSSDEIKFHNLMRDMVRSECTSISYI